MNLEILKSHIESLGLLKQTIFSINGQEAIDFAKNELDKALHSFGSELNLKPVPLMLIDFQMPLKNGIQVVQEIR